MSTLSVTRGVRASRIDLELARRLDWRFLLPTPNLGKVAYFGKPGLLLQALETFSTSVSMLMPEAPSEWGAGTFDVAVVPDASEYLLRAAARVLRPSGFLYAELGGKRQWPHQILQLPRCKQVLARLDFDQIRAFWARPDFDCCRELIPIDDCAARTYAFERARNHATGRLKMAAARIVAALGIMPLLTLCSAVIARKLEP
jgi:hypothetical protein